MPWNFKPREKKNILKEPELTVDSFFEENAKRWSIEKLNHFFLHMR